MEIKNWEIIKLFGKYVLLGDVYDNPKFDDGTTVTTSPIKRIITGKIFNKVYTQNSIYLIRNSEMRYKFKKHFADVCKDLRRTIEYE